MSYVFLLVESLGMRFDVCERSLVVGVSVFVLCRHCRYDCVAHDSRV